MPEIIMRKLDMLNRCIERIVANTPEKPELLFDDYTRQDVIVLNLQRAIQVCVDIGLHVFSKRSEPLPDSMREVFAGLERMRILDAATAEGLQKAVGFRNVAVHTYQEIDYRVVYAICTRHLDVFREFARRILVQVDGE